MAARAIAELGGESSPIVREPLPDRLAGNPREMGPTISPLTYGRGEKVATRRAYGDA